MFGKRVEWCHSVILLVQPSQKHSLGNRTIRELVGERPRTAENAQVYESDRLEVFLNLFYVVELRVESR